MNELMGMAERLTAALEELTDETYLRASRVPDDDLVLDGPRRYVQFGCFGNSLRIESVGDRYLTEELRLTHDQVRTLGRLGFHSPDATDNHWLHLDRGRCEDAATIGLRALEEVHTASLDQVDFRGPPTAVAALGRGSAHEEERPTCCGRPMAELVIGMPDPQFLDELFRQEVVLAGCVFSFDEPSAAECFLCGRRI